MCKRTYVRESAFTELLILKLRLNSILRIENLNQTRIQIELSIAEMFHFRILFIKLIINYDNNKECYYIK